MKKGTHVTWSFKTYKILKYHLQSMLLEADLAESPFPLILGKTKLQSP